MTTTYTWVINQLDCYPEADGEQDVVFTVHWSLLGEEAGFSGSVSLSGTRNAVAPPSTCNTPSYQFAGGSVPSTRNVTVAVCPTPTVADVGEMPPFDGQSTELKSCEILPEIFVTAPP